MNILIMALQCGVFIFIPLVTFFIGIWKILPNIKKKYYSVSMSALIGFIFFEGVAIGFLIDPRNVGKSFQEALMTAIVIGFIIFLFVLIFNPVYIAIIRAFKK